MMQISSLRALWLAFVLGIGFSAGAALINVPAGYFQSTWLRGFKLVPINQADHDHAH